MEDTSETKVVLLSESDLNSDLKVMKLRHPGTNKGAFFIIDNDIKELLSFNEKHRSWFFNDTVSSNGQIYIPINVDPSYFMLNLLIKNTNRATPLDQLVEDEEFSESTSKLLEILKTEDFSSFADQKGPDDLKAYKFNQEKTLQWLQKKCNAVIEAMQKSEKKISTEEQATSSSYVKAKNDGNDDFTGLLVTAHGIISEYISVELSQKLAKFLNLPDETKTNAATAAANKRKSMQDLETPDVKKSRQSNDGGGGSQANSKSKAKDEKKVKDLAKAASGSKNIMSFFKKK